MVFENLLGNMELLIRIILGLLLAVAFLSHFLIKRQRDEKQKEDHLPSIGANLGCLFLSGFGVIIFAFMNYVFWGNIFWWIAIGCLIVFSFVFIKTFLDELQHTRNQQVIIKFINDYTTDSAIPLSLFMIFVVFTMIFIIVLPNLFIPWGVVLIIDTAVFGNIIIWVMRKPRKKSYIINPLYISNQ